MGLKGEVFAIVCPAPVINMKEQTKLAIELSLKNARQKHPVFAENLGHALLLAQEELGEAIQAYNNKDVDGVVKEISHTAAVLVRILNGEFLK